MSSRRVLTFPLRRSHPEAAPSRDRAPARAWLMLGLGLVAYVVAVFQRTSFGVAGLEAQRRFGISAAVLSLFTVVQLAVYAGLQIPVGMLLDRVGSRRLIAAGAATMGIGQLVLATAHSVLPAVLGRVLVGGGDAMTFISVLRLIPAWFPGRHAPLLTQLTAILGQLGQIAAAYPLVALLRHVGWATSFTAAGCAAFAIALLVMLWLRNAPADAPPPVRMASRAEIGPRLARVWRQPGTRLGLWTHFVTQFSAVVFALLWGYPFLVLGEHRTPAEAGLLLGLLVACSMLVGPTLGRLAVRWPFRRSVSTLSIVSMTVTVWTVVLLWPGRAPMALLIVLMAVLSTNGPGSMMGFDYARTEIAPDQVGSANGIVNVGGFVASLTTTALIGIVLSLTASGGPQTYTLGEFKLAFAVQYPIWALGLIGVFRSRRRLRAAKGVELDPLHRAVVRHWRAGRSTA